MFETMLMRIKIKTKLVAVLQMNVWKFAAVLKVALTLHIPNW